MPKVTIGLPVYNGENYLEEAIRSVQAQSMTDFELLISDNASTDGTAEICRDYVAADPRVRYSRSATNLGAAPNYNRVFGQSAGTYFKWLAHDDRIQPGYLEATAGVLDGNPDCVLCNTVVDYIGENGQHLGLYRSVMNDAAGPTPAERFATMILRSHTCVDFFGLLRRDAMADSLLHQPFSGADKAFLAQMALRGRLIQLDEPLVQMREHPNRYTRRTKSSREKLAWHDTRHEGGRDVPALRLYRTYKQLVEAEDLSDAERAACRRVLRRFWFDSWNGLRLLADLLSVPFPRVVDLAVKVKFRLFGAPGNFID